MLQKGLQCRRSGNDSPQPMRLGMQGPGMPSIAAVALMRAADLDVQAVFWTPESNNSSPHLTARMLRFEVANRGAASSKQTPSPGPKKMGTHHGDKAGDFPKMSPARVLVPPLITHKSSLPHHHRHWSFVGCASRPLGL